MTRNLAADTPPSAGNRRGLVVGIGCRRSTTMTTVRAHVVRVLAEVGGTERDVAALVTIDTHAGPSEPGTPGRAGTSAVADYAAILGVPLRTYPATVLARQDVPTPAADVARHVGTPGVAEAAVLAAGATLRVPKQKDAATTVAVGVLDAPAGEAATGRPQHDGPDHGTPGGLPDVEEEERA